MFLNLKDVENVNYMKFLFSGGGTLGPVTPLVAIIEKIQKDRAGDEIFWISTVGGKENIFLKDLGIKVYPIHAAKLRRYVSFENFLDIFIFIKSLFVSFYYLKKINPDIIISAGGYVSVPLVIIGKLLKKKIHIHQQDIQIGLANKIMSYFADVITVSFKEQLENFKNKNIYFTGNPCRFTSEQINSLKKEDIIKKYNLKEDKKIALVLGGSSGANSLNEVIYNSINLLVPRCQLVHITGFDKGNPVDSDDYFQMEFLKDEAMELMFVSDIVISRSGLATLTELSALKKATITIPLSGHQEYNAKYFYDKNAVEIANYDNLVERVCILLESDNRRSVLSDNINNIFPHDSTDKIIKHIIE